MNASAPSVSRRRGGSSPKGRSQSRRLAAMLLSGSLRGAQRFTQQRAVEILGDRLWLGVDLVRDVERVSDQPRSVERIQPFLLVEACERLLRAQKARARQELAVLLGRHA